MFIPNSDFILSANLEPIFPKYNLALLDCLTEVVTNLSISLLLLTTLTLPLQKLFISCWVYLIILPLLF